ncbi:hypothetical protein GMRT_16142 [Giardia muris]|uniref:Uncharacterized protein n=1 Tax=Giardia muris TaxID=5742 RepID=A0A4Z1TBW5_GIAMU|nr:hypothetical protein GMRT_16142 [Giardia muris]|eukprot:TNJ30737.1 hypothetical protein GMRT_16142 [Giardia muris]
MVTLERLPEAIISLEGLMGPIQVVASSTLVVFYSTRALAIILIKDLWLALNTQQALRRYTSPPLQGVLKVITSDDAVLILSHIPSSRYPILTCIDPTTGLIVTTTEGNTCQLNLQTIDAIEEITLLIIGTTVVFASGPNTPMYCCPIERLHEEAAWMTLRSNGVGGVSQDGSIFAISFGNQLTLAHSDELDRPFALINMATVSLSQSSTSLTKLLGGIPIITSFLDVTGFPSSGSSSSPNALWLILRQGLIVRLCLRTREVDLIFPYERNKKVAEIISWNPNATGTRLYEFSIPDETPSMTKTITASSVVSCKCDAKKSLTTVSPEDTRQLQQTIVRDRAFLALSGEYQEFIRRHQHSVGIGVGQAIRRAIAALVNKYTSNLPCTETTRVELQTHLIKGCHSHLKSMKHERIGKSSSTSFSPPPPPILLRTSCSSIPINTFAHTISPPILAEEALRELQARHGKSSPSLHFHCKVQQQMKVLFGTISEISDDQPVESFLVLGGDPEAQTPALLIGVRDRSAFIFLT